MAKQKHALQNSIQKQHEWKQGGAVVMSCSYRGVRAAGTCVHCARERGSGSTRGGYWALVLVQHRTVIRKAFPGPNIGIVRCAPYRNDMSCLHNAALHIAGPGVAFGDGPDRPETVLAHALG